MRPGIDYEVASCPLDGRTDDHPHDWAEELGLNDPRCEICEEPIRPNDEAAEMYDPAQPDEDSVVCHAHCGLALKMEVA